MRIVLYGHGHYSAVVLERLLRPDREISVQYDADATPAFVRTVRAYGLEVGRVPVDLVVAAGYRRYIDIERIAHTRYGGIGYHPSLLPLHRGRDAVKWAIHMGDRVTGGTVYRLTEDIDGGPIYEQRHVFIRPTDTARSLWDRDLAPLGIELLERTIDRIASGAQPVPQADLPGSWEPGFPVRVSA